MKTKALLTLCLGLLCSGCVYESHPKDPSNQPGWRFNFGSRSKVVSELTPNYGPKAPAADAVGGTPDETAAACRAIVPLPA